MNLRPFFALLLLWLVGCQPTPPPASPTPAPIPPAEPTPTLAQPVLSTNPPPTTPATVAPLPTATPVADTGWVELRPGLERRQIPVLNEAGKVVELVYIVRLDPTQYQLEIGYSPGRPQSLPNWLEETQAVMVVNGGYFTEEQTATGLLIAQGEVYGQSYGGFAGMLAITQAGEAQLRWVEQEPYRPEEQLWGALQSFPILVKPGGVLGFPADQESGRVARRTVIAQDTSGRFLFIITPLGHFTLHQLSLYLAESDLQLEIALNLDGGPSSGLLMADFPQEGFSAFYGLPTVITVYER